MYYNIKPAWIAIELLFLITGHNVIAQKGKDGVRSFYAAANIPNRYSGLVAPLASGATDLTVKNINELRGSYSFPNSIDAFTVDTLGFGDLIMLIQVQGASIDTSDNINYGRVLSLNNTGNYEFAQVFSVSGNTIHLCEGTSRRYSAGGTSKTQVVRVPRFSNFTVASAGIISGQVWNGITGGVVAIEIKNNMILNGVISADTIGFRGGTDEINGAVIASPNSSVNFYRRVRTDSSAEKGESIAGDSATYIKLNGGNGRGAPANGGGGGNGHNGGGGGGSNAGFNGHTTPYNGTGIKDTAGNWDSAWNLEGVGFSMDSSMGGGRGGYTYGMADLDALTQGLGLSVWEGDGRDNSGGFGGHPLDYAGDKVLFMGGGGGAGDGNNDRWGNGGRGGGIIFISAGGNISGTGSIHSNGQDGFSTRLVFGNDAAGGAGGAGAIKLSAFGTITGISLNANGGIGGKQIINSAESEGPGGGGGGGYIQTTVTAISRSVNGGANGTTSSTALTEFTPNGATKGSPGTLSTILFSDIVAGSCNPLPLTLLEFNAIKNKETVLLNWNTASEIGLSHFNIERSWNGNNWNTILLLPAKNSNGISYYTSSDNNPLLGKSYYRLTMYDKDGEYKYSKIVAVDFRQESSIKIYPNPVRGNILHIESMHVIQKVQLLNATGQVVLNKQIGQVSAAISIPVLSPGTYIVRIMTMTETITNNVAIER